MVRMWRMFSIFPHSSGQLVCTCYYILCSWVFHFMLMNACLCWTAQVSMCCLVCGVLALHCFLMINATLRGSPTLQSYSKSLQWTLPVVLFIQCRSGTHRHANKSQEHHRNGRWGPFTVKVTFVAVHLAIFVTVRCQYVCLMFGYVQFARQLTHMHCNFMPSFSYIS